MNNKEKYRQLIKYYEIYGNINVPISYKVTLDSGEILNLGNFLNSLRNKYRNMKMNPEEIKFLESLNISWNPYEDNWNFMYGLLKRYKHLYGTLEMPLNYTVNEKGKIIQLGRWLSNQKMKYRNTMGVATTKYNRWHISPERIKLLEDLGINWQSTNEQIWDKKYQVAFTYFKNNGNLNMPKGYEASYDKDKKFNLYCWLADNKRKYLHNKDILTTKQIEALKIINITKFGSVNYNWYFMYNEAKKYYVEHGNLKVPATYSYLDQNDNVINLGYWINIQRKKYKNNVNPDNKNTCNLKLTSKEISFLNQIGMIWKINLSFDEVLPYLKKYYEHYGNLRIPHGFKTDDGFTYNKDGKINLYNSLNTFKHNTDPLSPKGLLLSEMGVVFPKKVGIATFKKICSENDIDYELNKTVLEHISFGEFVGKIEFLKEKGVNITENGYLNPIFIMSSKDIYDTYNLTLEDIMGLCKKMTLKK